MTNTYFKYDLAAELNDLLDDEFDSNDAAEIIWNQYAVTDRLHYDENMSFTFDGEPVVTFNARSKRFAAVV